MDGLLYETTHADALLTAGGLYGPETLTPLLALAPSRALGDAPVDHAKTQGAFGDIVGRLDVGAGDKGEIVPTVGAEALGQDRRRAPGLGSVEPFVENRLGSAPDDAGRFPVRVDRVDGSVETGS